MSHSTPLAFSFTFGLDSSVCDDYIVQSTLAAQGSIWTMHVQFECKDDSQYAAAKDIEYRLFVSLLRGLQVDVFCQGDIFRGPIFFFMYPPHPRTLVTGETMTVEEAQMLKQSIERFFRNYTFGTVRLGDVCEPVVMLTKVISLLA